MQTIAKNELCNSFVFVDLYANYRDTVEAPVPMIYQSGYLTIKGYNREDEEYKLDRPATEGMAQIADRGYAEPYAHDGRTVYAIACSFSSETGTISDWMVRQEERE